MTLDTNRLETLAAQLIDVQLRLQPLRDQEAALKAQIREALNGEGPGTYQAGNVAVTAKATRRLDLDAIAADFPAERFPQLYKLAPDTKAVRAKLPPEVIEAHMKVAGDMSIGLTQ